MHQSFDNSKRSVTDRNISPFQGPQPVNSSSYPLRNQEVNVSRGIFSSKKENAQSEIITPRTKTDQARILPGSYAQVLKEFLDNDLQAQITQFRNEMIKVMNESLRDFNEKSNRNHETISAIKESIKNHGNNIDVLDQKIEEYHLSLNTIGELFQSEIEKIKQNLPSHRGSYQESKRRTGENLNPQQDQRFQKLERQQKDLLASFERLKEELTESIQIALQDYGHVSEKDTNDRVNQISNEIAQNMEQKIEKVLNHLDAKVLVLEKQIQTYGRPDDAIVDNLKFQMEDKINEQTLSIRQQIQNLYQMIEAKPDDSQLRTGSALGGELDQRIDQTRDELAVLRSELGSIIEQVRSNSKSLNAKLEDYERKFNEECNQLRKQKASAGSSQNYDTFERKIGSIEGHFDEIHHEQMNLANDISIQKAQLDSFKTTAAVNFSDIKNSQTEMGDIRLKKLEQLVDQLSKTVETLKPGLTDSTSSLKFQETPPSSEPVTRSALKHENFTSFGLPATAKPLPYSSSTAYQTKDPIDYSSTGYKNPASPYTEPAYLKSGEKEYHKNYLGYGHPVPMEGQRLTPDRLRPTEGYSNPIIGSSPEGFAQYKATYGSKLDSYAAEPRTWDKYSGGYQDPIAKKEEEKISRDQKNRRSNGGEFNEEDEVEVVYQINEHGYLMDEDGNFIYDDQGEMIKLNEKQIQRLRENNLLEEEHTVAH